MKKTDLKSGMKVSLVDGREYIYLDTGNEFNLISPTIDTYIDLNEYSDDLKEEKYECEDFDIDSVYECGESILSLFCNLSDVKWTKIWQRELEAEEISAEEAMKRLEEQSGKKVKIIR